MLEMPETLTLAKQLSETVIGDKAQSVLPPSKAHKFCWYQGDPADYDKRIAGCKLVSAEGFGSFAELAFDNGQRLCVNDGVNLRLMDEVPKDYQLAIRLASGRALVFTVAMYGGIMLHGDDFDNSYYDKSRQALPISSPAFEEKYYDLLSKSKRSLSAKAFLATEQRFPGVGNGVLQDILFEARVHPKRKLQTFDESDMAALLDAMRLTLADMIKKGGRDTEKDLFGNPGGYQTKMSKNTLATGCPVCGGAITKEAYMGGSVYYCPNCQEERRS